MNQKIINTVTLAYFSGTGCTKATADCFEKQLLEHKIQVHKINIAKDDTYKVMEKDKLPDLLIILSPVYAFRLATNVEKWVKKLPLSEGSMAAIISVSGGGEISPNTACRTNCKRYLSKKGYELIYENMIVMPSNFATQANPQINALLLQVLPQKVEKIIANILEGKRCILKPKFQDRLFYALGKAEHFGSPVFGLFIHASNQCNQCGQCIQNCPKKNISMKNNKPKFSYHCIWCLKCIYSCPCKALSPRILKSVVLKEGFNLEKMKDVDNAYLVEEDSKKLLWEGAIKYIKEK
jgi:ferredoxin